MKKYYKTTEKLEKAIHTFKVYGYVIEKKRVRCACGESYGAIVFKGEKHMLNEAEILVKCECCYNMAKITERGE